MKFKEIIIVAMVLGAAAAFAWWTHGNEEARRIETQERIAKLEGQPKLTYEALRQAAWEGQHPCGSGIVIPAPFYAMNQFPVEFPTKDSKWCQARVLEQKQRQAKLDAESLRMPADKMFDCAYDYDGDVLTIDRVDSPNVHNSWVLGGPCEKLAHRLQNLELEGEIWNSSYVLDDDPRRFGLCVGFTDDSPIEAHKCQTEMRRWLEVFCLNTTEDWPIRECLQHQLSVPTMDSDKPFQP
jgi:hypothetical protein